MIHTDEDAEPAAPVQLARADDFSLGAFQVRPSARELAVDGRVERIEPRVMQVLVVLALSEGAVVARQDLIERCWGGVIVGEDAINRVMLKIRRLSQLDGGRSFTLETVPRVGYRLTLAKPAADAARLPPLPAVANALRKRWRLLAGAAAAMIAAGVLIGSLAKPEARYDLASIEMVAQTGRAEMHPALSPDGRFIVYAVAEGLAREAPTDLYMRSLADGEEMRLTDTPEHELAPAFSPTGDRLAFVRVDHDAGSPCRLFVRVFPSGLERQVGACEANTWVTRLAWTGDGQGLIFNDVKAENAAQGPTELRLLDLRSGEAHALVEPAAGGIGDFNASVSPDGRRVAFVRHGALNAADAFVYELATGRLTRVTQDEPVMHVAWAPDSRRLFVITNDPNSTQLSLRRVDGRGAVQRYVLGPSIILRPSGANGLLAFERYTLVENLMRAGASEPGAITSGVQSDTGADFSADGVLAYFSAQSEAWLYLQNPGEEPRRLAALTEYSPRSPRWSPDGREIVFAGTLEGRGGLFIVDAESGLVRKLLIAGDEEPANPTWAPDGRSVLYTAASSAGLRLLRLPLDPGSAPEPLSDYGWFDVLETSDGLFARKLGESGVWRLAQGREPEQIFPELGPPMDPSSGRMSMREWAVADGLIYGVSWSDGGPVHVLAKPLDGGPAVEVATLDKSFGGSLAVDPRTGDIVYTAVIDEQVDVGVMRFGGPGAFLGRLEP